MSTDPGTANSGNSVPCSGKCQERKHKIISVPVMGAQLQHRVPEAAPLEPQPLQGLCPTGTSGLLLSFTGSIFLPFSALSKGEFLWVLWKRSP